MNIGLKLLIVHNLTNKSIQLNYNEIKDERNILVYPILLSRQETKKTTKLKPYKTLVFKHNLH